MLEKEEKKGLKLHFYYNNVFLLVLTFMSGLEDYLNHAFLYKELIPRYLLGILYVILYVFKDINYAPPPFARVVAALIPSFYSFLPLKYNENYINNSFNFYNNMIHLFFKILIFSFVKR